MRKTSSGPTVGGIPNDIGEAWFHLERTICWWFSKSKLMTIFPLNTYRFLSGKYQPRRYLRENVSRKNSLFNQIVSEGWSRIESGSSFRRPQKTSAQVSILWCCTVLVWIPTPWRHEPEPGSISLDSQPGMCLFVAWGELLSTSRTNTCTRNGSPCCIGPISGPLNSGIQFSIDIFLALRLSITGIELFRKLPNGFAFESRKNDNRTFCGRELFQMSDNRQKKTKILIRPLFGSLSSH